MNKDAVRKALELSAGDPAIAARHLGVTTRTMNRWISRGLRLEVYEKYGQPPQGARSTRPEATRRAKYYARRCGQEPLAIARAQVDVDDGKFLSLASANGDMVTIRFGARGEIDRLWGLLVPRDGAPTEIEEEKIVAEIQVTSAAQKDRLARIEKAVRRFCPEMAEKILGE